MFGAQTGRAVSGAAAVAAAALVGLAACGTTPQTTAEQAATPTPSSSPSARPATAPTAERMPVAEAGGVCKLLSYGTAKRGTGVDFDIAAAGKHKKSTSCVLQVYGHPYPDLTLTITPTKADAAKFSETVPPDGAKSVDKLGETAYRVVLGAKGKAGPAAEIGWLADGSIVTLRHTHESGVPKEQAQTTTRTLATLARQVQKRR